MIDISDIFRNRVDQEDINFTSSRSFIYKNTLSVYGIRLEDGDYEIEISNIKSPKSIIYRIIAKLEYVITGYTFRILNSYFDEYYVPAEIREYKNLIYSYGYELPTKTIIEIYCVRIIDDRVYLKYNFCAHSYFQTPIQDYTIEVSSSLKTSEYEVIIWKKNEIVKFFKEEKYEDIIMNLINLPSKYLSDDDCLENLKTKDEILKFIFNIENEERNKK